MAVVQLIASLGMALSIATPSYAGNGQREQTVARILELSSFATDQGNVGILIYPRLRYGHPIRLENCLAHIETWSVRAGGGTYLRSETILDLRHVSVPNPTSADFPTDMTEHWVLGLEHSTLLLTMDTGGN